GTGGGKTTDHGTTSERDLEKPWCRMNFEVLWAKMAEQDLTRLWLAAPDRDAIREAANEIDWHLERHPQDVGESREENRRLCFVRPLAVSYGVDPAQRRVVVDHVWRVGRPPSATTS